MALNHSANDENRFSNYLNDLSEDLQTKMNIQLLKPLNEIQKDIEEIIEGKVSLIGNKTKLKKYFQQMKSAMYTDKESQLFASKIMNQINILLHTEQSQKRVKKRPKARNKENAKPRKLPKFNEDQNEKTFSVSDIPLSLLTNTNFIPNSSQGGDSSTDNVLLKILQTPSVIKSSQMESQKIDELISSQIEIGSQIIGSNCSTPSLIFTPSENFTLTTQECTPAETLQDGTTLNDQMLDSILLTPLENVNLTEENPKNNSETPNNGMELTVLERTPSPVFHGFSTQKSKPIESEDLFPTLTWNENNNAMPALYPGIPDEYNIFDNLPTRTQLLDSFKEIVTESKNVLHSVTKCLHQLITDKKKIEGDLDNYAENMKVLLEISEEFNEICSKENNSVGIKKFS